MLILTTPIRTRVQEGLRRKIHNAEFVNGKMRDKLNRLQVLFAPPPNLSPTQPLPTPPPFPHSMAGAKGE